MKADKIKALIRKKFGTIARFADLAKLDKSEVQKVFMPFYMKSKDYDDVRTRYAAIAVRIKVTGRDGEITTKDLGKLRKAIDEAGGPYRVHIDKAIARSTVYEIYNGDRIRMTPAVQEMFDIFKIAINS